MSWARQVYEITAGFPDAERFGLQSQMRRAAVSVAANIAEGVGRNTSADFARFVEISYGSLMEVVCQCTLAAEFGYVNKDERHRFRRDADEIARMLSALRHSRER